jgi:D-3-phosphoglycerate dehydrogenase / 2-oxoglutarate reductase
VSYVNAPQIAERRGLQVRETSTSTPGEYVNLVTLRSPAHAVAGTLTPGPTGGPRIVMIDDHQVEATPSSHMLVIRNDDRPGMIGVVGTVLGEAGISIRSMALAPSTTAATALMVLSVDAEVTAPVLGALSARPGILSVARVSL